MPLTRSWKPPALDVYNEGALIFPAVKIQENYKHVMDVVRMCQMRIRVPTFYKVVPLLRIQARAVQETLHNIGDFSGIF